MLANTSPALKKVIASICVVLVPVGMLLAFKVRFEHPLSELKRAEVLIVGVVTNIDLYLLSAAMMDSNDGSFDRTFSRVRLCVEVKRVLFARTNPPPQFVLADYGENRDADSVKWEKRDIVSTNEYVFVLLPTSGEYASNAPGLFRAGRVYRIGAEKDLVSLRNELQGIPVDPWWGVMNMMRITNSIPKPWLTPN
jgi:hypothetical protein